MMKSLKFFLKKLLWFVGIKKKINWTKRVNNLGAGSVFDSRTSVADRESVTYLQSKIYLDLLETRCSGKRFSAILDFGCGIGRHFDMLKSLKSVTESIKIVGYDPTESLLTYAADHKYDVLTSAPVNYKEFDLIFIHMVLGGLSDHEALQQLNNMLTKIPDNGCILLIEAVSDLKPREYSSWKVRKKSFYMPENDRMRWEVLGSVYENQDELMVFLALPNNE